MKKNKKNTMRMLKIVLNMLAEETTIEIPKTKEPQTFERNQQVAQHGGQIVFPDKPYFNADNSPLMVVL